MPRLRPVGIRGNHRTRQRRLELGHGLPRRPRQHPRLHRPGQLVGQHPGRLIDRTGLRGVDPPGLPQRKRLGQRRQQPTRQPDPGTRAAPGQVQRHPDLIRGVLTAHPRRPRRIRRRVRRTAPGQLGQQPRLPRRRPRPEPVEPDHRLDQRVVRQPARIRGGRVQIQRQPPRRLAPTEGEQRLVRRGIVPLRGQPITDPVKIGIGVGEQPLQRPVELIVKLVVKLVGGHVAAMTLAGVGSHIFEHVFDSTARSQLGVSGSEAGSRAPAKDRGSQLVRGHTAVGSEGGRRARSGLGPGPDDRSRRCAPVRYTTSSATVRTATVRTATTRALDPNRWLPG